MRHDGLPSSVASQLDGFLRLRQAWCESALVSYPRPLVFLAEFTFAVSLILGLGVRLVSTLAIIFVLHLWLGIYRPGSPAEWPWSYLFLAMVLFMFAVHRSPLVSFAHIPQSPVESDSTPWIVLPQREQWYSPTTRFFFTASAPRSTRL